VHERGIIHRDFKTSNIMVDSRGRVRLLDFGIARVAGADTGTFTAAGHVIGTPEYMSPEQALGARLDFRSDIYALGCVVFEIFSGQAVFQGETPLVTLFKHINEAPPLEAAWGPIPPALVAPLRSALAKDPAGRYQTVALFATALTDARAHCVLDAPTAGPAPNGPSATASPETATIHRPDPGPMETAPYRGAGRPAAPRDKRVWAIPAVLAVAAGAGALWMRDLAPSAPQTVAVSPAPAVAPGTAPLDAASPPLPEAAGQRPLAAPAAGPASATPAPTPRPSPPERPRPAATPDPMPPGRAPALGDATTGTLRLVVVPPAEVTVDGRLVGTVSAQTLRLPPGRHVVRFLHPDYKPLQRTVTVTPGGTVELPIDLAEKAIPIPR
jgi:serine/threonine-protein kinase